MPPDFSPALDLETASFEDRLLHHFYSWEYRGRGWMLYDDPVDLEPPFRPFYWEVAEPAPQAPRDDGRRHTWLSGLIAKITDRPRKPTAPEPDYSSLLDEPDPEMVDSPGLTAELRLTLPAGYRVSHEACRRFLQTLKYLSRPLAFELVGTGEAITVQFACHPQDEGAVASQLSAFFPECVLRRGDGGMQAVWEERMLSSSLVVDFGLSEEFMLPLHTFSQYDPDPLTAVAGVMQGLGRGDVAVFQVLLQPVLHPWSENLLRAVLDSRGDPVFDDFPELGKLAREKVSSELFAAGVRLAVRCVDRNQNWPVMRALGGSLAQFSRIEGNELVPLSNDGYDPNDHEIDLVERRSRRSGMILNSEEVLSLVHPPSASVRSAKMNRTIEKSKAPPALATGGDWVLGYHVEEGMGSPVTLTPDQRSRHLYAIGASGTGKSTFLLHLLQQDLDQGNGFAVLDPHGDLIDQIVGLLPEHRLNDVVLLDPSDEEYAVGLNILAAHSELEKNLLSSDLVSVFRRLSTSWGDQMTSVLGNAILAFLESSLGGTLLDLRRFLVDRDFRTEFLHTVSDPLVVYYWHKEFPLLSGKPQGPILTRLDTFLRPKPIRSMVAQKETRLDFRSLMDEGKILLARLSQGAVGEENAYLLGSLLVSKLHQAAMSRQEQKESERRPFALYIDECHHFVTPSMASILAGARKYRLSLILAHQELRQLGNPDVASAVLTNPYTRVCFRVGDQDARKLAEGFSYFEASDLLNLGTGEAIARVERAEYDFNFSVPPLPEIDASRMESNRENVVRLTRERYARSRKEVEEEIARSHPASQTSPSVKEKPVPKEERGNSPAQPPSFTAPSEPIPVSEPSVSEAHPSESPPVEKPRPKPTLPPTPGRGGPEHKRLHHRVKLRGEELGFRVHVEKPLPSGGFVDVSVEGEQSRIACEISVTSTPKQEVGNVRKCLDDGYTHVVVLVEDEKRIARIQQKVLSSLPPSEQGKVQVMTIQELDLFLIERGAKEKSRTDVVRGRKVTRNFVVASQESEQGKARTVAGLVGKNVAKAKSRRRARKEGTGDAQTD